MSNHTSHNKILILSDVHGNIDKLQKVLDWAETRDIHNIWNLGDTYGYREGSKADQCWDLLREKAQINIMGNHDLFAAQGRELINLKQGTSIPKPEYQEELAHLKAWEKVKVNDWRVWMYHASPMDALWDFLDNVDDAKAAWAKVNDVPDIILIGHSHQPMVYRYMHGQHIIINESLDQLKLVPSKEQRLIINPGSVGSGEQRGYFAVLHLDNEHNPELVTWHRV